MLCVWIWQLILWVLIVLCYMCVHISCAASYLMCVHILCVFISHMCSYLICVYISCVFISLFCLFQVSLDHEFDVVLCLVHHMHFLYSFLFQINVNSNMSVYISVLFHLIWIWFSYASTTIKIHKTRTVYMQHPPASLL